MTLDYLDYLEEKVEKALNDGAQWLGGATRKLRWVGRRGAPDRLVLLPRQRRVVYVELKRPRGGVLEAHQQREHDRLRECGQDVRVLWSVEAVDEFYREMLRDTPP